MFSQARYEESSFNIFFARQPQIRRLAFKFEDALKGYYQSPQLIPVPDDLDPEIPRMIFTSDHGFSQIIISQVNLTMKVTYSSDWKVDVSRCKEYLLKRVQLVFDLIKNIGEVKPCFCGLSTRVDVQSSLSNEEILNHLAEVFSRPHEFKNKHDFQVKLTSVVSGDFFSNITVLNYRIWKNGSQQDIVPRLSSGNAAERGIRILGDFNDRRAYNENENYFTGPDKVTTIIDLGIAELQKVLEKVKVVN